MYHKWKNDVLLHEYGVCVGDLLIHDDKAHKVTKQSLYKPLGIDDGVVKVYRYVSPNFVHIGVIERSAEVELLSHLRPQKKLSKLDLLTIIKSKSVDPNAKIAYTYKKGRSYEVKKVSVATLKMNFHSIVSYRERNYYWDDAPDIEYAKKSWYKMSKKQKRQFTQFVNEV